MTTLYPCEALDEIVQTLDAVRSRRWLVNLVTAALAFVAISTAALLAAALIGGYWPGQPPAALRWTLLTAACVAGAGSLVWFLLRALVWRQNLAQTARFVEQGLPQLRNDLINSILLAAEQDAASQDIIQEAIREAAGHARDVDAQGTVSTTRLRRWGAAAALAVAMLATFAVLAPGRFGRGIMGMVPGQYVGTVNTLELIRLTPGDAKIFAGTPVEIAAEVRNPDGRPLKGQLLLRGAAPRRMAASADSTSFTYPLGPQDQSFEYAVQIGGSRWPQDREYYSITVIKGVQLEAMSLRYEYPSYTRLEANEVKVADGAIAAPRGTTVTVKVRLSEAVPSAVLEMKGGAQQLLTGQSGGTVFSATIPVNADGGYRLTFLDDARRTLLQLPDANQGARVGDSHSDAARTRLEGYYPITAVPDAPPKVEFLAPGRDATVAPGGQLATKVKVYDRYGLTKAELYASKEGQPPRLVNAFDVAGKSEGVFDHALGLEGYSLGDVVVYFATATDNRSLPGLEPQTTESVRFKVLVQDPNAAAQERARNLEEIRKRLLAILKMQETQRVSAEICRRQYKELAQVKAAGAAITAGQKDIKAQMLDVVQNVRFDPDTTPIQQAVALLAQNDGQLAIDQSSVLEKIATMATRDAAAGVLTSTQDRIIAVLQDLLAILPSLSRQSLGADKYRPGAELPPEVRAKLKDLDENLKKFIEEQRKAVEAGKNLAKKPVDAFTAEDEKVLSELKALQDKWEKFLEEAMSDFSKLAQQDFSNPQLMKELISVKSDVTMAKDALSQKAVEIATAIEDNGIENAKELTANLEKWLPDVPDRQEWKMENPTDDMNINTEQPNLPSQLEDLVGDLLEQEEELFDEMQDQTGKYTMSGDKGIGWDAMDGPISNMNAQGVTGNQLPNANEMSGRSGEGRQGKSSGEYVEDKAVGKGGRRTPTRLTPEPFQKGEINDQSTEPAGGSTGGGKLSGSGGEGLEGPVPPPLAKEMQRLAGKQADLISRGRKFLENYKQTDYASFRLLQTITLLDKVRDDLENNRYRNALRQRQDVREALQQTRLATGRKVDVTVDTSAAMPKYIKDSISDAMKGKMPEEFRDVLEEYYKRLSENGGK